VARIATVVIPTFQLPEMLSDCLHGTARACAAVPPGSVDVVVTDDSRDQITLQLVQQEFPWVQYVKGPRRGPASNRNCGASKANSPWLVFTDDDCVPDPHWLAAYIAATGAGGSATLFEGRAYADRARRSYAEESPVNETGGGLWSCNMAIGTALFRRVGGFCESFPYPTLEDVEFRLRLQDAGHQPKFVAAASVCHPFRP
jgi:GT2 family glycosyltransferase